jgi:hypothetical protein
MLTEGSFTIFISTEKDQLLPPIRRVAQVTETITYADPMVDESIITEGINLRNDAEREEFWRLCDEIGIYTANDLIRFRDEVGCTDENILQALRDYRAELGLDFKIANPELEREMAKKYEDIDFDGLVEELEEHEDMVECKECYDLVSKESCHKNKDGKYVCEKCCKTLTEDVARLTPEQLTEMEAYLKSGKALQLEEYEEEYDSAVDIVSGELTYNTKTNTFDFCLGIYHASEDNNAEYPEYHTDEEEYSFDSLEEIYDEFPQYLEDIYKWHAGDFSKLEEAKCIDCGGELKDNKCTSCNRDFNLAKCKYCGGEVKDGKCMYCNTKVDVVKCQYCGGEVENGKCTCCNELVENAMANGGFRTDGYRTALASYDSDDYELNVELGLADEDDYEVVDEEYLLCPGQTVADLVVYLSYMCGFTNIYVRGERSAFRDDIRTLKRFKTVPGNHDYNDYGTIEDRLVESTSDTLIEAAGSKDKIKSEFDEAGYETEGTYTFDKIYDAYVKAKKSEPTSLEDFIEYIRETVISVNELYGTLGLPAPETYKVKRKAVAKMRADGSTVTEAIPMTRDELMSKEGTDDVELINAGRPEEERVELVEVDRTP